MTPTTVLRVRPTYEATLKHTPVGWGWQVRRNGRIIGSCHGLLSIFYRNRAAALQAASVFAQHDHERYQIRLPVWSRYEDLPS